MTDEEWAAIKLMYRALWTHEATPPGPVLETWRRMLERFEPATVAAAINDIAEQGGPYRPEIGQVIVKCRELSQPAIPLFGEVYQELRKTASGASWLSSPSELHWSHPLVRAVASQIGWDAFMNSNEGDSAMRAHIRRVYDDLVESGKGVMVYPNLDGAPETQAILPGWEKIGAN